MESSASKVTGRVFTTSENGMDASPAERQPTGTVSVLGDGPQRSTSVFCSFSLSSFFIIQALAWRQRDWTFVNALSSDEALAWRQRDTTFVNALSSDEALAWRQRDSTFVNALSSDEASVVMRDYTARNLGQKMIVNAEPVNESSPKTLSPLTGQFNLTNNYKDH